MPQMQQDEFSAGGPTRQSWLSWYESTLSIVTAASAQLQFGDFANFTLQQNGPGKSPMRIGVALGVLGQMDDSNKFGSQDSDPLHPPAGPLSRGRSLQAEILPLLQNILGRSYFLEPNLPCI